MSKAWTRPCGGIACPEAYQSVAAALGAGPQPDYIGTDLDAIAGQLIDKYGPAAGQ
jgi:hypothetical protein